MSDEFTIKRGDTSPSIKYMLEPAALNIAGAQVQFQMWDRRKRVIVDRPGFVVEEGPNAVVQYDWQPGETDVEGRYQAEFRLTYPDGAVETFPNDGFIPIRIGEDVR